MIKKYLDQLLDCFHGIVGSNDTDKDNCKDRIARFADKTGGKISLPDSPDEERLISYQLFFEDIDGIHKLMERSLKEALKGEEQVVKEFA